ncbi:substrate-binding domain-containing protein [Microbacterium sp. NC79]|uniref:sugar ABC transporter substrate-binding protein n=1 Tax=Microbacterium sp. NC79 TaxID=2851009 RepID=UPI001C2C9020|nr:substrate-binding domain-containing protein [Microbacterium sp. NC79]MBV0895525.1 substrate-binding domain-containing protein [Microbacterium sp. NC79]
MHRKLAVLGATLAVATLALTACSADGSAGGGDDAAPATDKVATAAAAKVKDVLLRPTSIGIDEPIAGDVPADKEIYFMQCALPACQDLGNTIEASIDAVGWTLTRIDSGLTPEDTKAAWGQAVLDNPDAVITSGSARAVWADEAATLAARGIPVLDMNSSQEPTESVPVNHFGPAEFAAAGERLANFVMSQSGAGTNAVTFMVSAMDVTPIGTAAFTDTISENCESCTADVVDLPVDALGGDLSSRIVTYLQSHPDVNWVNLAWADMMVGVPDALRASGVGENVRFVTVGYGAAAMGYLADGDYLAAIDTPSGYEFAWRHVDTLLRMFNGEDIAPSVAHTYPAWIVTKDTLPSRDETFPSVVDFADQFKALWGV